MPGIDKSHLCPYFTYSSPQRLLILSTNKNPGHYQWQNSQKVMASVQLSVITGAHPQERRQSRNGAAVPHLSESSCFTPFRTALEAKLHHLVSAESMHTEHLFPECQQCRKISGGRFVVDNFGKKKNWNKSRKCEKNLR